jgi:tetratricopeptide (TPR) repeat protein
LIELGYEDPLTAAARERRAAQEFDEALKRAQALIETGRLADAIGGLNQLAEHAPATPRVRWLLARAYFQAGELNAAAAALQWLEWHGSEQAEFSVLRSTIALRRREFRVAIEQAEYARHLRTPLPAAELILGEAFFRTGELQAAAAAYRCALQADEPSPAALAGLAAISLRSGAYQEAVDWALQALENNIQLPSTHYRLGLALMHIGRQAEAIAALEAAARILPQLAGPHRWLARLYEPVDGERATQHRALGSQIVNRRRARRCAAAEITAAGT